MQSLSYNDMCAAPLWYFSCMLHCRPLLNVSSLTVRLWYDESLGSFYMTLCTPQERLTSHFFGILLFWTLKYSPFAVHHEIHHAFVQGGQSGQKITPQSNHNHDPHSQLWPLFSILNCLDIYQTRNRTNFNHFKHDTALKFSSPQEYIILERNLVKLIRPIIMVI